MTTIWEETKAQGSKMKGRPFKEKVTYFWEYYKIHTIVVIAVIFILYSLIHAFVTAKDYALSVAMLNSLGETFATTVDSYEEDLSSLIDFDSKKYEVVIDASYQMGTNDTTASAEYSYMQKLAALMSSKSLDVVISNMEMFEQYSQNEYFYDLRELYSEDELAKYSDYIYYTDAATYSDYEMNSVEESGKTIQDKYIINHHDPSAMKDPIPCGFFLPDSSPISQAGLYAHITELEQYQGYQEEAVMGIVINSPRTAEAMTAISYFMGE